MRGEMCRRLKPAGVWGAAGDHHLKVVVSIKRDILTTNFSWWVNGSPSHSPLTGFNRWHKSANSSILSDGILTANSFRTQADSCLRRNEDGKEERDTLTTNFSWWSGRITPPTPTTLVVKEFYYAGTLIS